MVGAKSDVEVYVVVHWAREAPAAGILRFSKLARDGATVEETKLELMGSSRLKTGDMRGPMLLARSASKFNVSDRPSKDARSAAYDSCSAE